MKMTCAILHEISKIEEETFSANFESYKTSLLTVAEWKQSHATCPASLVAEVSQLQKSPPLSTYRRLYYAVKLETPIASDSLLSLSNDYFAGLRWVFSYYTAGVSSWSWFFAHSYAPFASDLAEFISFFAF